MLDLFRDSAVEGLDQLLVERALHLPHVVLYRAPEQKKIDSSACENGSQTDTQLAIVRIRPHRVSAEERNAWCTQFNQQHRRVHVEQPPTSENAFTFRGTVETPGYEVRMHACIPARPTRRAPLTEQNVCPSVLLVKSVKNGVLF